VLALQHRLQALGYWLSTADGNYGSLTEQAVTAFQKVEGLQPEGIAGPDTAGALAQAVRPQPRSDHGNLVEVDKGRQVLLVVRDGSVAWVVNTSTGNGRPYQSGGVSQVAETPSGRWTVSRAVDGIRQAPLGSLYRPRYFHDDGIAVHGSPSVPPYPASHGCVRVTDAAMDWIWASDTMPMGSTVWVYD
jgi:lipoprotein-anchoring transpeptidase ErfK/SrfK